MASSVGLPSGLVRDLIALGLTGTLIQQTVVGAIDPITFLGIAGPFLGFYVSQRGEEDRSVAVAKAAAEEPLPPPFIPQPDDDERGEVKLDDPS